MAHVKAGSSRAHQKANVAGKHRGLKVNQGQFVNGGQILVRQTGVNYKPGLNTKLARDSSVISKLAGVVSFSYLRRPNGLKTVVNVTPKVAAESNTVKKVAAKKPASEKVVKKTTVKNVKIKKSEVKKAKVKAKTKSKVKTKAKKAAKK